MSKYRIVVERVSVERHSKSMRNSRDTDGVMKTKNSSLVICSLEGAPTSMPLSALPFPSLCKRMALPWSWCFILKSEKSHFLYFISPDPVFLQLGLTEGLKTDLCVWLFSGLLSADMRASHISAFYLNFPSLNRETMAVKRALGEEVMWG